MIITIIYGLRFLSSVLDLQKLEREARICRMLKHPNIGEFFFERWYYFNIEKYKGSIFLIFFSLILTAIDKNKIWLNYCYFSYLFFSSFTRKYSRRRSTLFSFWFVSFCCYFTFFSFQILVLVFWFNLTT